MRVTRRRIMTVCLALMLGTATSVATAWIAGARWWRIGDSQIWTVISGDSGGWVGHRWGETMIDVLESGVVTRHEGITPATWWQGPVVAQAVRRVEGRQGYGVYAAGWPLRCLWAETYRLPGGFGAAIADGDPAIELTSPHPPSNQAPRALPARPLWIGLIGNTALYAVAWWALIILPVLIQRQWRRSRGRCVHCGYDISGCSHKQCPECGSAISIRARRDR